MKLSRVFRVMSCLALLFAQRIPSVSAADYIMTEVMSGLDSPRGLAWGPDGGLYVAEAGRGGSEPTSIVIEGQARFFGSSGAVSRLISGVQERVVSGLPSLSVESGESAGGLHDIAFNSTGELLGVIGLGTSPSGRSTLGSAGANLGQLVQLPLTGAAPQPLADLAAYEAATNPDGAEINSNPYGLLRNPNGGFFVTDAGGNDVLDVSAVGAVATRSVLPPRPNPLPIGPPVFQSVPTGIAQGPDAAIYFGQLTGFPFPPGEANVYRLDPANNDRTVVHAGFTNIIDLTFDDDGNLYVLQFTRNGIGPTPGPGQLFKIAAADGNRTLIADTGLLFPSSVLASSDGSLYVSNRGTSVGGGQVLRLSLVPEPASLPLLATGLLSLLGCRSLRIKESRTR